LLSHMNSTAVAAGWRLCLPGIRSASCHPCCIRCCIRGTLTMLQVHNSFGAACAFMCVRALKGFLDGAGLRDMAPDAEETWHHGRLQQQQPLPMRNAG
jgi:hypothetical protein